MDLKHCWWEFSSSKKINYTEWMHGPSPKIKGYFSIIMVSALMCSVSLKLIKIFHWQGDIWNQAVNVSGETKFWSVQEKAVCTKILHSHFKNHFNHFTVCSDSHHFISHKKICHWIGVTQIGKSLFCFLFLHITIDPFHSQFSNTFRWVNYFQQFKFSWCFLYSTEIWQINSS